MTELFSFFTALEVQNLQRLSQWFYQSGVGRSQITWSLPKSFFFTISNVESQGMTVFVHDANKKEARRFENNKFDFFKHITVQVEQDLYSISQKLAVSKYHIVKESVERTELASFATPELERGVELSGFSVARLSKNSLYVTGGMDVLKGRKAQKSALRYDLRGDTWESDLPEMQQQRFNHGSCALGKNLFVFGGRGPEFEPLDSIEMLTVPAGLTWEILDFPEALVGRSVPMMLALNEHEILISGGYLTGGQLVDVFTLDMRTQTQNMLLDFNGIPFVCHGQSAMLKPGLVVALVTAHDDTYHMVNYSKGMEEIKSLAQFIPDQ